MTTRTTGASAPVLTSPHWGTQPIPNRKRRGRLPACITPLSSVPRLRIGALAEIRFEDARINHGTRVRILGFDAEGRVEISALQGQLAIVNASGEVVDHVQSGRIPAYCLRRICLGDRNHD